MSATRTHPITVVLAALVLLFAFVGSVALAYSILWWTS